MSLVYFLPGRTFPIANPAQLPAECDFGDLFEGAALASAPAQGTGPGDRDGYYFCVDQPGKFRRFDNQNVTWYPVGPEEKPTHYVGIDRSTPPKPSDLLRPHPMGGHPVRLADGNDWTIPVICLNRSSLPRRFVYRGGKTKLEVPSTYEAIVTESYWWFQLLVDGAVGEGQTPLTAQRFFDWSVSLLTLNYRVGPVEVGVMEILDDHDETTKAILHTALGMLEFLHDSQMVESKKNTPAVGC